MEIAAWPIVGRSQLVQAFRPGESATREAPFRTLRVRGCATAGISIVTRNGQRAAGRLTMFSLLNVDAARLARHGDETSAVVLASAASKLEGSKEFGRLAELLAGMSIEVITAVLDGVLPEATPTELDRLLRKLAKDTHKARSHQLVTTALREVLVGRISEAQSDFVVLTAASGSRTAVPRWLAHAAHRENVGDCLALVTEKLDDRSAVIDAVPGIDLDHHVPRAKFNAFGRSARVHHLTPADERLLSRPPRALKILIPVTMGS